MGTTFFHVCFPPPKKKNYISQNWRHISAPYQRWQPLCHFHITFLGCKQEMIGQLLTFKFWHVTKVCKAGPLFSRGSGVIRPVCYFKVGNLCYGRLSFSVSNCLPFLGCCLRVVLSFKRLYSGLVWADLTFPWSALNSISLCRLLNHALTLIFMRENIYFSLRRRSYKWARTFFLTNEKGHCFLAPAKLSYSAILNNFVKKIVTVIRKSLELFLYRISITYSYS